MEFFKRSRFTVFPRPGKSPVIDFLSIILVYKMRQDSMCSTNLDTSTRLNLIYAFFAGIIKKKQINLLLRKKNFLFFPKYC